MPSVSLHGGQRAGGPCQCGAKGSLGNLLRSHSDSGAGRAVAGAGSSALGHSSSRLLLTSQRRSGGPATSGCVVPGSTRGGLHLFPLKMLLSLLLSFMSPPPAFPSAPQSPSNLFT